MGSNPGSAIYSSCVTLGSHLGSLRLFPQLEKEDNTHLLGLL